MHFNVLAEVSRETAAQVHLGQLALFGILLDGPAIDSVVRKFDRMLALEVEPSTSASVIVGDIDGDGNLDILLAKGRHWPEKKSRPAGY